MGFVELDIKKLDINPFEYIGDKWMLITCGDEKKFNTMTASWGGMGVLWRKNVTFSFIRPQRYTFEFMETNEYYTLSFLKDGYKKALSICGSLSGRDRNKIEESGLTAIHDHNSTFFKESEIVMVCRKLYADFISPECFNDMSLDADYKNKDYHKMYIGEVVKLLVNRDE